MTGMWELSKFNHRYFLLQRESDQLFVQLMAHRKGKRAIERLLPSLSEVSGGVLSSFDHLQSDSVAQR